MRRKSLYMICGAGIFLTEYGHLLVEVGHDIEHFAMGRIAGLKDSPQMTTTIKLNDELIGTATAR